MKVAVGFGLGIAVAMVAMVSALRVEGGNLLERVVCERELTLCDFGIIEPVMTAEADELTSLLQELTEEGIENGHFGFQGRVASGMRVGVIGDHYGFAEVEEWVLREVEWDVGRVDRERSIEGAFAVVPVVARGAGDLGESHESAGVVARYMVLYGTAGEFPGLLAVRPDGEPLVIYDILENKYDWRIAVPD